MIIYLNFYNFVFYLLLKKHFGQNLIICNIKTHMVSNIKKKHFKVESREKTSRLWGFSKYNYYIFIFGLVSIFFGYTVMAIGEVYSFQSLTIAPIFLFIGYIIIIPLSLIIKIKEK